MQPDRPSVGVGRTRCAILAAARRRFADQGYGGATVRAIAADVGVDAALLYYFYDSKSSLFNAAMRVEATPGYVEVDVPDQSPDDQIAAIARHVLSIWEAPDVQDAILGLLRSTASSERAPEMLRDLIQDTTLDPVRRMIGGPDSSWGSAVVASLFLGLVLTQEVLRMDSVLWADGDTLAGIVGPTIEEYGADDELTA